MNNQLHTRNQHFLLKRQTDLKTKEVGIGLLMFCPATATWCRWEKKRKRERCFFIYFNVHNCL